MGKLLDGFVEGLGRFMAVFAQYFILGKQQALYSPHKSSALSRQVGVNLSLESRFEQITRTHAYTECDNTIFCTAGSILINSIARIQTATLQEHTTQAGSRTLRCNHDYIDIGRRNDMGTLLIGNAETMREIERLSGCQIRFDARPNLDLSGIGKQVLDNGGTLASLFDFKKRLTGTPPVGNGLLPCFSAFTLSHNHIETVITQVKALSRSLYAITDYRDHLIFEDFSCFFQRKFFTGNYIFVNSAKINYCHFVFVF